MGQGPLAGTGADQDGQAPNRSRAGAAVAPAVAQLAVVGRVGGPYGVRGWLRVVSFTEPPANLLTYRPWRLRLPQERNQWGCWRSCDLSAVQAHGEGFIASFGGVADRAAALRLSGAQIGVPVSSLPPLPEDEFYWRDLIGLRVLNENGDELGLVERLLPTGGSDVLVVQGAAEVLIPFVEAYVTEVRSEEGCIRVRWEGLD